jgi:hypothetical protein
MQSFEHTPPEARELLSCPIRDLGLELEGSMLEKYVQQLHAELAAKGLARFRPGVYLGRMGLPGQGAGGFTER